MNSKSIQKIDKFIPWMFVLFFILIACVDTIFVLTAIKTQTGLVADNAYETGLNYNEILKKSKEQKELGWSHQFNVSKDGAIEFSFKDEQGKPITGADISLLCFRPTQSGFDIKSKLVETEYGVYSAHPNYPMSGLWHLFITGNINDVTYKANKEITIQR